MCRKCLRRIECKIQNALSEDLLKPNQLSKLESGDHFTTGHCYVAAEAAYHYVGGKRAGWKPICIRLPEIKNTHWYIQHKDGMIIDPTKEQFNGRPPYDRGKGSGFLTNKPSRRARTVLEKISNNF